MEYEALLKAGRPTPPPVEKPVSGKEKAAAVGLTVAALALPLLMFCGFVAIAVYGFRKAKS